MPRAIDLSLYDHPHGVRQPAQPVPKGHIWSSRLASWVVPIQRRNSRRPSAQHIYCSEPPCWVLVEPLQN